MVAFGKEQLHRHPAVGLQARRGGENRHALHGFGGAGRQQALAVDLLHQAQAAGTHRGQAIQMAERGHATAGGADRLQQRGTGGHRR